MKFDEIRSALPGALRALRTRGERTEVFRKAIRRLVGRARDPKAVAARGWAAQHAAPYHAEDSDLWEEALRWSTAFSPYARERLAEAEVKLGGGGDTTLLYYLVRRHRPEIVFETGVAAGFSSAAILAALHANGHGHLFSSDLPYFRVADAHRYIGWVVPEELRDRWTLETGGDRANFERLCPQVDHIDMVHYDSDKSYAGREWAMTYLRPWLRPGAPLVFDDIQDNMHFADFTQDRDFEVVRSQAKFVGICSAGTASQES